METFTYDEARYTPTDVSFNELLLGSLATIYKAGNTPRDF